MENYNTINRQNVWINFNNQFGHTWLNIISIKSKTFKDSLTSNMSHLNSLLQSHIFRQLFPKFSKVKLWSLKFFSSEWATVLYSTASPQGASLDRRFWVDFNICKIIWIMEPPSSEAESCPSSTLMFRSSSSLQAGMSRESRERAGVPTGTQFVPDSRWPLTNKRRSSWKQIERR